MLFFLPLLCYPFSSFLSPFFGPFLVFYPTLPPPPSRPPCPFPFEFFASHFCLFGNFTLDSPSRPLSLLLAFARSRRSPWHRHHHHLLSTFCGNQPPAPVRLSVCPLPFSSSPVHDHSRRRVHPVVDLPTKSTRFASLSAPPAWLPNQTSARRMPFLVYPGGLDCTASNMSVILRISQPKFPAVWDDTHRGHDGRRPESSRRPSPERLLVLPRGVLSFACILDPVFPRAASSPGSLRLPHLADLPPFLVGARSRSRSSPVPAPASVSRPRCCLPRKARTSCSPT